MTAAASAASPGFAFCPCCGHNLDAERPVVLGPLDYDPRGRTRWAGALVCLTVGEHLVLGSIVAAHGGFVTAAVIGERIDHSGLANCVQVLVHRVRRALAAAGAPATAILTAQGRGYRLNTDMLASWSADQGAAPCR